MRIYSANLRTIYLKDAIKNMRLDVFLTEKGYFESRKKAADNIKAGNVFVNGVAVTKSAFDVCDCHNVTVTGELCPYVGRGGFKLEGALKAFSVDTKGKICVDIGSSTGGFTDCLLQKGACRVYAVDSGKDQLHPKLREDSRVVCMEGVNARILDSSMLGEKCDIAVMDVSFISQTLLHSSVSQLLKEDGIFISLIKPQFEVGPSLVGKKGIVKDEKARLYACERVKESALAYGLEAQKIIPSPILGGDGNKEFLGLFRLSAK